MFGVGRGLSDCFTVKKILFRLFSSPRTKVSCLSRIDHTCFQPRDMKKTEAEKEVFSRRLPLILLGTQCCQLFSNAGILGQKICIRIGVVEEEGKHDGRNPCRFS